MDLAKLNLGKYLLVLDEGEELHGPVDELVAYAEKTDRAYVFCKHFQSAPCGPYYKLRLIHREHIPENMHDFVGPRRDAAKLRGLVNYDGAVTGSVYTTGDVEPIPPARQFTDEMAARESVLDPSPEAHFTLGFAASAVPDDREALRQIELGQKLSDEAFDVRPWNRVDREYYPAALAVAAATMLNQHLKAKQNLRRAESVAHTQCTREANVRLAESETLPQKVVYVISNTPLSTEAFASRYQDGLQKRVVVIVGSDFEAALVRKRAPFFPRVVVKPQVAQLREDRTRLAHNKRNVIVVHGDTQQIVDQVRAAGILVATTSDPEHRDAKLYVSVPHDEPLDANDLLRAQASGAVPVVLGVGALPEYVLRGYWYRPPFTAEVVALMVKRIVYLLTHEPERYDLAREALVLATSGPDPKDIVEDVLCGLDGEQP